MRNKIFLSSSANYGQEDEILPLFKSLKAPKANISMNIDKASFNLGDTIEGTCLVHGSVACLWKPFMRFAF